MMYSEMKTRKISKMVGGRIAWGISACIPIWRNAWSVECLRTQEGQSTVEHAKDYALEYDVYFRNVPVSCDDWQNQAFGSQQINKGRAASSPRR